MGVRWACLVLGRGLTARRRNAHSARATVATPPPPHLYRHASTPPHLYRRIFRRLSRHPYLRVAPRAIVVHNRRGDDLAMRLEAYLVASIQLCISFCSTLPERTTLDYHVLVVLNNASIGEYERQRTLVLRRFTAENNGAARVQVHLSFVSAALAYDTRYERLCDVVNRDRKAAIVSVGHVTADVQRRLEVLSSYLAMPFFSYDTVST